MIVINTRILLPAQYRCWFLAPATRTNRVKSRCAGGESHRRGNGQRYRHQQSRVDLIANQNAGAGQPDSPGVRKGIVDQLIMQSLVTEEAVKKRTGQTGRGHRADRVEPPDRPGRCICTGFHEEQPRQRRHAENRVRTLQEQPRQRIQSPPYPGGERGRGQGHHRHAAKRSRSLCQTWPRKNRKIPPPRQKAATWDGSIRAG